MTTLTTRGLKEHLFKAYQGFADKRIKSMDRGRLFIVDDRGPGDFDARKHLFLWFCQIFVEVESHDQIKLILRGDVPEGPEVVQWMKEHSAKIDEAGVTIVIQSEQTADLLVLASCFRAIVRRRYSVKSYKYVVPRTATSIEQLASVLKGAGWP